MITWDIEINHYKRMFHIITGRTTNIHKIPKNSQDIGYTLRNADIFLAEEHPIMMGLNLNEKRFFREGVFAHEMCHQLFTDFAYAEKRFGEIRNPATRKIAQLLHNLVEDPAIEYEAPNAFEGEMLNALRYSIKWIYQQSPEITDSPNAFSQFANALIHFGDLGIVKGHFSFPEAKEYFKKIAPEFNEMILEPDPDKRIDTAIKWAEITRPLWEPLYQNDLEMFNTTCSALEQASSKSSQSKSAPIQQGKKRLNKDEIEEQRDKNASLIQEENDSNDSDDSDSSDDSNDSDESNSSNDAENIDGESSETDSSSDDTEEQNKGTDTSSKNQEEKQINKSSEKESNEKDSVDSICMDNQKANEFTKPLSTISNKEIKELNDKIEKKYKEQEKNEQEPIDFEIKTLKGETNTSCHNERVQMRSNNLFAYQQIKQQQNAIILSVKNGLQKIFTLDADHYIKATSGKYNIKRAMTHETVKIFNKKREAQHIDDIAVLLLVDESGSMYGKPIATARITAIILSEVFASLKIPCSIIGFTADYRGHTVTHFHYVSWKNTQQERASLMNMEAYANNYDGYSIRYATEYLSRKNAEHKILFIISDGLPACFSYRSRKEGYEDTAASIVEAKRKVDILGIGINIRDKKVMEKMYNGSFICIDHVEDLPKTLVSQLKRILKHYL